MQGPRNYTQEEIDYGRTAVGKQLTAYKNLASATTDKPTESAVESFEALFFNNLTMVMDRYFVHRLAGAGYEGKDGNPLHEVRLIVDSLITNNGVLRVDKQIKLTPERSVLKLCMGDTIQLSQADFEQLSEAFSTELERRFLQRSPSQH